MNEGDEGARPPPTTGLSSEGVLRKETAEYLGLHPEEIGKLSEEGPSAPSQARSVHPAGSGSGEADFLLAHSSLPIRVSQLQNDLTVLSGPFGCLFCVTGPQPPAPLVWAYKCFLSSLLRLARFEKVVAALTLLHLSAFCCHAGLALQLLKMTEPEGCFPPAAPWVDHHPWGAGGSAQLFPVPGTRGWATEGHCLPDGRGR